MDRQFKVNIKNMEDQSTDKVKLKKRGMNKEKGNAQVQRVCVKLNRKLLLHRRALKNKRKKCVKNECG